MLNQITWVMWLLGHPVLFSFWIDQCIPLVFAFSVKFPGASSLSSAESNLLDARVPGGDAGAGSLLLFPFPFPEKGRKSRLFLGRRPILATRNVCPCRPPREGWSVNPHETQCLNPRDAFGSRFRGWQPGGPASPSRRAMMPWWKSQFLVRWGHCVWISLFVESLGLMTWKNV